MKLFTVSPPIPCASFLNSHQDMSPFTFPPVPMLDHLCSALLHPDDALKASVVTVWLRLHEAAQGAVAQALPAAVRDRVCILLLQTLSNASSPSLINNCVGEEKPLCLSELLFCFINKLLRLLTLKVDRT